MFEKNISNIKKLGELECVIYEFSTAIFLRESSSMLKMQTEKFSEILENRLANRNISQNEFIDNKNLLVQKFEEIVKSFLDYIEAFYATVLEKMQLAETNQNLIYIKKATFEHLFTLLENANTEEEKEKLLEASKQLNISLNNLGNKIYTAEEKIKLYDEMINMCEKEFEVCEYTREVEIEKMMDIKYDLEALNIKSAENNLEYFEMVTELLEKLETHVSQLNNNLENYIINFISKIDMFQNKILE